MEYIIDKNNYKKYNIGTKAINLFKMAEQGINIPNFFCINNEWLEKKLKEKKHSINKLIKEIDYFDEDNVEYFSNKINDLIEETFEDSEFKEFVNQYISNNFKQDDNFAIRSSSILEDSEAVSFAGQFNSFLDIKQEEIFSYILKCYKSLYAPNVLSYCNYHNISTSKLKMNVIVQLMVNPEASGVIFSANPQGILNEAVVVIGQGVGKNIVEDKISTTTYYYNLADDLYYYEMQENSPVLQEDTLKKLIELSKKISGLFKKYMDIEYAIYEDIVYILQARPITTIKDTGENIILDNSNIVESYPGITLSLTKSFIRIAYYEIFKSCFNRLTNNSKCVKHFDDLLENMVDSANGRIFYRISNWYNLILLLPFSKKIIPIWQEMMGVENKQITSNKNKRVNWLVKFKVSINVFNMLISTPKRMDKLNTYFEQIPEYFNDKYSEDLTSKELINLFEDLKNKLITNWDITLINDLYSFIFTGLLKNKLKKMKIHNYDFIANKYISNLSNLESMKPIKELVSIAIYAKENNLYDELRELKTDERTKNYLNSNKKFANLFNKYINEFGDRNVEELKLESKTYRTNPNLLINRICEYVKDSNLYDMIEENEIIDDAIIENKKLEFYKKKASIGIRNREKSRFNRSIIYGMIRQIFLSIGNNFVSDERILSQNDIFYLLYEEILEGIKDNGFNLKRIIVKRKREYRRYKALPEYTRLVFSDKIINKQPLNIKIDEADFDEHILIGIPCSTGIVEGEVVVIDDPKNYKNIKDKILVTKMTDPGWVFLLTRAKGIVAEKGSLLSHTAIISRELGKPSVVGVDNITNMLKTGDRIKLNGNTGEIEIL